MADNAHTVRGIDYKAVFPFVHLFRGFRLAVDPSKLALALAGLVLLYLGGRVLDAMWPESYRASHGEIEKAACAVGMQTMYENGLRQVLAGTTSLAEILRSIRLEG